MDDNWKYFLKLGVHHNYKLSRVCDNSSDSNNLLQKRKMKSQKYRQFCLRFLLYADFIVLLISILLQ